MLIYKINKISEVDISQLSYFFKKIYKNRYKSLTNNWRWWYRSDYKEFEPLILSIKDKIIGQAGLLPIDIKIQDKKISAIWFVDFAILPEYRGQGYGHILTKEWMKICPNQITFCNDQSLKIFKKLGWKNNLSTHRLIKPINVLKFLPITKKFNFNFTNKLLRNLINKKFNRSISINPYKINDNFHVITESFKNKFYLNNNENAEIIRDEKWLKWRLIECPYSQNIYFFEHNNSFAIVNLMIGEKIKRLNVIYTYSTDKSHEDELLILILNWAIKNSFDLVWAISRNKKFFLFT